MEVIMRKLLIVEDENKVRKALVECINWGQFEIEQIEEASNGQQALDIVVNFKPDIIITDIKMPGMDGLELTKRVKEFNEDIHVIIFSAHTDSEFFRTAIKYKAVDYLLKPVDKTELENAIWSAVKSCKQTSKNKLLSENIQTIVNKNIPELRDGFYQYLLTKDMKPVKDSTMTKDSMLAKNIKKLIEENFQGQELSVKFIADKMFYTSAYICMIFKNETGMTVNDYTNLYRLEKAKELLIDARLKLYDISSAVGYSDQNYFSKVFKKYEGITPIEYRKKGL